MTVKIRQEINLTNVVADTVDAVEEIFGLGGLARCDPADYNGETAYFEIIAKNTDTTDHLPSLCDSSTPNRATSSIRTLTVPANTNSWTLFRSPSFTLHTTNIYYNYWIYELEDDDISIQSAKIIILQSATDITDTQTQIEVGQYGLIVPADSGIKYVIPEPKYWKYEEAKWDPTPTFKFAFTMGIEDDKETYLIGLQEASDAAFTSDLLYISDTEVTVNTEIVTYYESAAFTPKDGYFYRIQYESDDDKGDEIYFYNAKVICTQTGTITKLQPEYLLINEAQTGTGLQEFLNDWEPDEWEGVDNEYYHEHSASGSGSNTKLIEEGSIYSFLTYIDTGDQIGSHDNVWGDGTYIYAACGTNGLRSYSVDGSGILTFIDVDDQGGDYYDVWGDGTYIYAACHGDGLRSYSVDGSGNLTYIDTDFQDSAYEGVWGDGTYIYVACLGGGLRSYSVDGSGILTYIDTDDQIGSHYNVWGDGTYIYAACGTYGLRSYSVDGSGILTFIDVDDQGGDYHDVWGDGTYIYAACLGGGLRSYSVDGSGNLTYIDTDFQGGDYYDVWGVGTYIYAACGADGLRSYSVDGSGILTHIDTDFQGVDNYHGVWVDGTYIYAACGGGLRSYSPKEMGDFITNSDITGDDLTRGASALTMPATAKEIDVLIVTA